MNNVKLEFTSDAIDELAALAEKKGTGARGLRSIMENLMLDVMYQLPQEGVTNCIVDGAAVRVDTPVKLTGKTAKRPSTRRKKA
jgi:ATP-dependent Clp protease ATP-binding subunit ClpX